MVKYKHLYGEVTIITKLLNYRKELEKFEWENATWTDDKLIAASPFRYDRTPSFYVWLRDNPQSNAKAGYWQDSGAYDPAYAKGNFVKLLAFLRNETEEETAQYLGHCYNNGEEDSDRWHIRVPQLAVERSREPLDEEAVLGELRDSTTHPYLSQRGISDHVQRQMDVGFDAKTRAISIPWRLADGRLANVKYRSVHGKTFWYAKGGWPIRDLVYGIDHVYRSRPALCAICEAEIDAMSVMTADFAAVAIGGVALSAAKLDELIRAPVTEYVVLADNDKAGEKLEQAMVDGLRGKKRVSTVKFPENTKDANELLVNEGVGSIKEAIAKRHVFGNFQLVNFAT